MVQHAEPAPAQPQAEFSAPVLQVHSAGGRRGDEIAIELGVRHDLAEFVFFRFVRKTVFYVSDYRGTKDLLAHKKRLQRDPVFLEDRSRVALGAGLRVCHLSSHPSVPALAPRVVARVADALAALTLDAL